MTGYKKKIWIKRKIKKITSLKAQTTMSKAFKRTLRRIKNILKDQDKNY